MTIPASEGALQGNYAFSVAYNQDGTVQSTTSPAAGGLSSEGIVQNYDDFLRPTKLYSELGTYVNTSEYSPTGKPWLYELGNTAGKRAWQRFTWEYGTQRLATSRTNRENITGADRDATFKYDDAGNVLSISDVSRTGTDTQCFGYDYLRRLTEAWAEGDTGCSATPSASVVGGPAPYWQSFTYDTAGNRKTEVQHGTGAAADTVRSYSYAQPGEGNKLSSVTQTGAAGDRTDSFSYDEIGNTTKRVLGGTTQSLVWGAEGELTNVTDSAKGGTSFIYDADGNRLIRKDPTGATLYLPGMELRLDTGATASKGTRYYTHGGQTIAMRTAGGVQYLSADHQGTSQLAINAADQALTQRRFTPFGAPRGEATEVWPGEKGFVGGTIDASTDLTHLGAREYDAATGRFISVDPVFNVDNPQQMNGYAYSENNPVTFSDPSGLCSPAAGCATNPRLANGCGENPGRGCSPDRPKVTAPTYPNSFPKVSGKVRQGRLRQHMDMLRETIREARDYREYLQGKIAFCSEYPGDVACKASNVHDDLDMLGMLPGGDVADLANAAIYASEGRWGMAALAGGAAVPGLGWLVGAAIWLKRASKLPVPCRSSFVPGTEVLLANAERRPIEDVKVGDKVLATDPETGETSAKEVLATITSDGQKNLVEVTVDTDGKRGDKTGLMIATDGHPFWVAGDLKKWIKAADLKPGMWLRTSAGTHVQITATKTWTRHQQVHNLTIADIHTYYVEAGTTPVLVHNDNSPIDLNGKSYTVWQRGPYRIDIEARNGTKQMHFQVQINGVNSGNAPKYQYDPETGQFEGMPKSLQKDLAKNYPD